MRKREKPSCSCPLSSPGVTSGRRLTWGRNTSLHDICRNVTPRQCNSLHQIVERHWRRCSRCVQPWLSKWLNGSVAVSARNKPKGKKQTWAANLSNFSLIKTSRTHVDFSMTKIDGWLSLQRLRMGRPLTQTHAHTHTNITAPSQPDHLDRCLSLKPLSRV